MRNRSRPKPTWSAPPNATSTSNTSSSAGTRRQQPFFEALVEVAARGVKVRILFDHISTRKMVPDYKGMLAKFDQAGIEWHPMLPIQPLKGEWRRPDLRNHRKIVVVDGRAAFVGSQNMVDSSYHNKKHEAAGRKWRELTTRVEGPIVHSINLVFAGDWYIETQERHRGDSSNPKASPTVSAT